ncbi:MAG TPA: ribonuclease H-like YkuK family protein [Patescibacteria group bacterium]|nr:ribonuclease H-like YkuK family protein [Patescibacteria group bacterium]
MSLKNGFFYNTNLGKVSTKKVVKHIGEFVSSDPTDFYSLIIGTDSQSRKINGVSEIDYVTAVVIYRRGHGARYFWRKEKIVQKPILRDKIYRETTMSLEMAQDLVPQIRRVISPAKYDLEIHIDVGSMGPTRAMIREVVGMVTGNGYVAKTKPESWGASSVADKHT